MSGNHENRPLSGRQASGEREVAYTDVGIDSGWGTFNPAKENIFGNAWPLREESGDTADREGN